MTLTGKNEEFHKHLIITFCEKITLIPQYFSQHGPGEVGWNFELICMTRKADFIIFPDKPILRI